LLEVGSPKVGFPEVGPEEVCLLEVGQDRERIPHICSWQPCFGEIRTVEYQRPLKRLGINSYVRHAQYNEDQDAVVDGNLPLTPVVWKVTEVVRIATHQ
jgi:hypothetical protein